MCITDYQDPSRSFRSMSQDKKKCQRQPLDSTWHWSFATSSNSLVYTLTSSCPDCKLLPEPDSCFYYSSSMWWVPVLSPKECLPLTASLSQRISLLWISLLTCEINLAPPPFSKSLREKQQGNRTVNLLSLLLSSLWFTVLDCHRPHTFLYCWHYQDLYPCPSIKYRIVIQVLVKVNDANQILKDYWW